ncbi:Hypothetical predicted protein [Marmota monax]|uniref:Uncharacterized protein n=1 Tax=Marmota monax TaxID=9995 RepID=A0A5E4AIB8_MARMO|nr:Hypothetical predicted protein [Marmota monax]
MCLAEEHFRGRLDIQSNRHWTQQAQEKKKETTTGTDALGHEEPPTIICTGAACVTEPPLLQLFHVTVPFTER